VDESSLNHRPHTTLRATHARATRPQPPASRLVCVVASNRNQKKRLRAQRDRVAGVYVTPGALRNVGGSAAVPSASSSLNVNASAIGLPSVSGWTERPGQSCRRRPRIDARSLPTLPLRSSLRCASRSRSRGRGWTDVQQLELPRLPREGELIETKYGTCQVTHSEATPEAEPVAGKIVCSIS